MTFVACLLAGLCIVAAFFSDAIVAALAPGYSEVAGKAELTSFLTRVMLPFLPLVSFAAIAMGMLNAEERYAIPALSPALFNVVAIVIGAALWALGLPPEQVVLGWSVGTLLGGAAQFLVQVPSLRRTGWRFRPEWSPRDPAMRSMGGLMIPATVGLAAVQINIFVNSNFASHEPGAVSWLQYAFRLLYLPIGLFGVAVGTIATTGLAKRASTGDIEGMRRTLQQALRMLAFLNVPATVGLTVLAEPIVRLLYERGLFGPADTEATATALLFYSLGLVAYTGVKVLAPAFYALGRPRVPLAASALAVATNLGVILALHESLGFRAVALGTSLGSLANAVLLGLAFERRLGGLLGRGLFGAIGRMSAAAAVMAPFTWLARSALEAGLGTQGLSAQATVGLVPVAVGAAVYMGAARLLRIPEAHGLIAAMRRRRPAPASD
jgi:putative peptidoglycan lipid II flippase